MNPAEYNPVASLTQEVDRFKATNRFNPLLVTGFYTDAACVLDYVRHLEDTVDYLIQCGERVCASTVAVPQFRAAVRKASRAKWWQAAVSCVGDGGKHSGCGYRGGKSGYQCPRCGGMLLSRASIVDATRLAETWALEKAANGGDK